MGEEVGGDGVGRYSHIRFLRGEMGSAVSFVASENESSCRRSYELHVASNDN
jgi:hypothetical protein